MNWFERLTGVEETSPEAVRARLVLDGEQLISRANGRTFRHGVLATPSLAELRQRATDTTPPAGRLRVREVIADVATLHSAPANAGALFQVASQFNLLEMVDPHVTPEDGIGCYEHDHTQGPACAIAAGAATIYRNYFVPVAGTPGQTADRQLDCLLDLGAALGNTGERLWRMQNGYALATRTGLTEISARLHSASASERDALRGLLRIGVHTNAQVTLGNANHTVTQVFCSALPVAHPYSSLPAAMWAEFARLVLEAAYEATLLVSRENVAKTGHRSAYLTLLGGGAFGNEIEWILAAAEWAISRHRNQDLDVVFVSYRSSRPEVQRWVGKMA